MTADDELNSELRALDREVAQFVLEAFQREAPEVLQGQLAAALAEALRPIQDRLDKIGGEVGETLGGVARNAQVEAQRATSLKADIIAAVQHAQEYVERHAFKLQQAVANIPPEVARVRGETPHAPSGREPLKIHSEPTAERHTGEWLEGDGTSISEGESAGWHRRNWGWLVGAAALALAAIAVFLFVAPIAPLRIEPAAVTGSPQPPAANEREAPVGSASAAQRGFDRVIDQISSNWSGAQQRMALQTLCGPVGENPTCPDLQARWLFGNRTRNEVQAALAVAVTALAEADNCGAPSAAAARAPAKSQARSTTDERGLKVLPGTVTSDVDPLTTLNCLLTEAGRAPRP